MTQRPAVNGGSHTANLAASLLSIPIRRQASPLNGAAAAPPANIPANIVDYWRRCGSGPLMPAVRDLDRDALARHWPNCLLVANHNGRYQFEERLGAPDAAGGAEIGTMAVEWLLTLCEETARRRTPLEKSDLFPAGAGDVRLHAVALPLADDGVTVDHILCHLTRAG